MKNKGKFYDERKIRRKCGYLRKSNVIFVVFVRIFDAKFFPL